MKNPDHLDAQDHFDEQARETIYRVIAARRDVRTGFTPEPLPEDLLRRLLAAAHCAPSVGLMQPSRFVVVRKLAVRQAVHRLFTQANAEAAASYTGEQQELYRSLRLDAILEAPQNLCVLCDSLSARGHKLGRKTMPETAIYSTVCAIQNLWLAARAEGVGVGWVSILSPERLREVLEIPSHLLPVAYLCLGFVDKFSPAPELERQGWEQRIALDEVLSYDVYRESGKP